IDAFAVVAIEANAAENGVAVRGRLQDLIGRDEGWDVVLAGDVAYERDLAEAATAWLAGLARRGATVLVGDPRRAYLALDRLDCVVDYSVAGQPGTGRYGEQAHRRLPLLLTDCPLRTAEHCQLDF